MLTLEVKQHDNLEFDGTDLQAVQVNGVSLIKNCVNTMFMPTQGEKVRRETLKQIFLIYEST